MQSLAPHNSGAVSVHRPTGREQRLYWFLIRLPCSADMPSLGFLLCQLSFEGLDAPLRRLGLSTPVIATPLSRAGLVRETIGGEKGNSTFFAARQDKHGRFVSGSEFAYQYGDENAVREPCIVNTAYGA